MDERKDMKAWLENFVQQVAITNTAFLGILVEKGVFTMREFDIALAKSKIEVESIQNEEAAEQRR